MLGKFSLLFVFVLLRENEKKILREFTYKINEETEIMISSGKTSESERSGKRKNKFPLKTSKAV